MNISLSLSDILLVLPIICLFVVSLLPLAFKVFFRENSLFALMSGFMGILGAIGLTALIWGADKTAFSQALIFDGISLWSTLLILLITFAVLLVSYESYSVCKKQFSEYVFLFLNVAIGLLIVVCSNDLIVLFVGLELMSLCFYMLIALNYRGRYSQEAAFKYFVLGSFAAAIFLYGVALIYGTTGNTYLTEISQVAVHLAATNRLFLIGFALSLLGIAFKVAIFPFHAWSPDVYQGASTPITSLMATAVKVAVFITLLRCVSTGVFLGERSDVLISAFEWMAVLTIFVGNVAAILQSNLKRMLAYSGIAHSGYAFIGVLATSVGKQSSLGVSSVVYYLLAYSIMTLGAFLFICLFEKKENTQVCLEDLKGLSKTYTGVSFCFAIILLSLAGLPPTVGFFGKLFIFSAAIKEGFFWLVVWGVLGSVVSVYYYLRPIIYMYMYEKKYSLTFSCKRWTLLGVSVSALLVVVAGVMVEPFYNIVLECLETF